MPIYEYKCRDCGHRTEIIQKVNDAPPSVCKNCGGILEKMISAPAIQFKGSGWYITDYAKKNSSPPKSNSESEAKSPASTESKTETKKPEKKKEAVPSSAD